MYDYSDGSADEAVRSPITGRVNVQPWDEIPSKKIIELYDADLDLDVHRQLGNLESVQIYKCLDSSYRFYYPFSVVGDGRFYADLESTFTYSMSLRWEHRRATEFVKKGMKVLEVGCGPGLFLRSLADEGCDTTGIELNKSAARQASERGLEVNCQLVKDFATDHAEKFDAVCFFQVLEHIDDVRGFLSDVISVVKPGGMIIVAVPNNNPYLHRWDRMHTLNLPPHHMGLWDKVSLGSLPNFFPLELIYLKAEPLVEARKQFKVVFEHRGWKMLARLVSRAPSVVDRVVERSIGRFTEGRNLLAVFRKK